MTALGGGLLLHRVVDAVHALDAVVRAGLEDVVLERPQRGPRRGSADHLVGLERGQDRERGRRPEGLGQREHVALDLGVHLRVRLRVVEVVLDVLGDVDVVATDAAVLVDPLPERLLRLDDRHAERGERALRQVGDRAEVDAPVVLVDGLRTRLLGHAGSRRSVPAIATAAAAGGHQCERCQQRSCLAYLHGPTPLVACMLGRSVAERPSLPVVADPHPDAEEPARLEQQEGDDQQAVEDGLELEDVGRDGRLRRR